MGDGATIGTSPRVGAYVDRDGNGGSTMEFPRDAIFGAVTAALAFRCIKEFASGWRRIAIRRILTAPAPLPAITDATAAVTDGRWT